MSDSIVHSSDPITLLGGGHATHADLTEALNIAPQLVAVDGGLVTALAAGRMPDAVIGDMDSAPPEALAQVPAARRHRISEQQSTDFDKALRGVDAPVLLGVGFCGARVDHELAAFHALARHADRPCILVAQTEVIVLAPPRITVATVAGETVSLFPLAPVTGQSDGLEWPIDGLTFDPMQFVGTSNRALGPITLTMAAPAMLLILPRRLLRPLAAHFATGAARWPARAGQHTPPPSS